jgi:group I intron endonuclease
MTRKYNMNLDDICEMLETSGIYKIYCSKNNKSYVGSSKKLRSRMRSHYHALVKNNHHSILLQRAWNKYGDEHFYILVARLCGRKELLAVEQLFLNREKKRKGKTFNICFVAGNCAGVKQSTETKEKRAAKLRGAKRTPEQCARISRARKRVGITPEHQELLNKISRRRRKTLSREKAYLLARRHAAGERWLDLEKEAGLSSHGFRREIRRHVKNKEFLKPHIVVPSSRTDPPRFEGENHPNAKLTKKQARAIYYAEGKHHEIGAKYGVTPACVRDIKYKRSWECLHV